MDLWQRSSLLPPSASLGSRHDDAAAPLGQPRFLHGDPRGSQGGEGQLRQPPPAPPGDLETVAAPWARGPHPPAASRPGWCFPPLGATFLKCTLARRWPDSQALGQRPTREVALAQLSRGARSGPTAFALVPPAGDALPIRGGLRCGRRAMAGQAAGGCGRSTPQPGGCGRGTPQPQAGARAPGRFALGGPGMNFASSAGGGAKPRGQGRGARRAARPLGKGRSHSHGSSAGAESTART